MWLLIHGIGTFIQTASDSKATLKDQWKINKSYGCTKINVISKTKTSKTKCEYILWNVRYVISTLRCNTMYKHMFIFVYNNPTHDLQHNEKFNYYKMIMISMITKITHKYCLVMIYYFYFSISSSICSWCICEYLLYEFGLSIKCW